MSGLINIDNHNAKVSEIEKAKSILDQAKPKNINSIGIPVDRDGIIRGRKCTRISFSYDADGTMSDSLKFITNGEDRCWIKVKDAVAIAACVIAAFGMPSEEITNSIVSE